MLILICWSIEKGENVWSVMSNEVLNITILNTKLCSLVIGLHSLSIRVNRREGLIEEIIYRIDGVSVKWSHIYFIIL
jgi:hypothetical protein